MAQISDSAIKADRGGGAFATTLWSMVIAAGDPSSAGSSEALERLCAAYWFPIYAFLRRQNYSCHDAQDLTQSFLSHLLTNQRLSSVHPAKGKFRSFLLGALKNFLANAWNKQNAQKRGGGLQIVSLTPEETEGRLSFEPWHDETPDKVFERSWALLLLESVIVELRSNYAAEGKAALFDAMQIYLSGDKGMNPYLEVAGRLGISESALKMSVLRMRRRFGDLLRKEIANTVSHPSEVDEEIRCLFAAVGG